MPQPNATSDRIEMDVFPLPEDLADGEDPEEIVATLNDLGMEWQVSEEGDLFVRTWQVAAEDFFPAEVVPDLRAMQDEEGEDELDWVGRNMAELRGRYGGQWIAVEDGQVIVAAPSLPDLLGQLEREEARDPLITSIPEEPETPHMSFGVFRA